MAVWERLNNYYFTQKQPGAALTVATQYYRHFLKNYITGMLYIKALLLNKQYAAANDALQRINILPNEGATDGRQLYKEIQLMLALAEMQKKNYKRALSYITAAKQWPENLGVGKPYEDDIDERLEDWLSYQTYIRLNNKEAAQQSLNKILAYTSLNKNIYPSPNTLFLHGPCKKQGNRKGQKSSWKKL